jgi:hypothetical protein
MSRTVVLLVAVISVVTLGAAGPALAQYEGDPAPTENWGVGAGLPYGGLGVNYETGEQTRLSAGVGWMYDIGWNVGVKHYFSEPVVGRGAGSISAYYGTNLVRRTIVIGPGYYSRDDETETGFSIGLGWTSGHFDIGLLYATNDAGAGFDERIGGVVLYLGYRL